MKRLYEGGTSVFINNSDHVAMVVAMPKYGKNLQKSSSPELYLVGVYFYHNYKGKYFPANIQNAWYFIMVAQRQYKMTQMT